MAINFNTAPYYDDFNADDKRVRGTRGIINENSRARACCRVCG